MLKSIKLTNFRGHDDTDVPLEPFTLLVGDNGMGKSTVLEAVHLHGQVFGKAIGMVFAAERDSRWIVGATPGTPATIRTNVDVEGKSYVEVSISRPEDQLEVTAKWSSGDEEHTLTAERLQRSPPPPALLPNRSAVVLKLIAKRLAEPSTSEDEKPRIEFDGYGFATALKELKATDTAVFKGFEGAVREVIPRLQEISFERVKQSIAVSRVLMIDGAPVRVPEKQIVMADQLSLRFEGSARLPAHCASEGTLLAMGVLAFLHLPDCPNVILLDDIDRGLHPRAQATLVEKLRKLLETRRNTPGLPDAQIIATSHSPYLVDAFAPEEVVLLKKREGKVAAVRLKDHPDQALLAALRTGEFLASSGKDWFGL